VGIEKDKRIELIADIEVHEETEALKKAVASIIELPKEDKQMDLLYFSAIYVSTGTNLNNAHFLPSELIAAEGTIVSKALDVEHKESDIIGHIYDCVFVDEKGNKLDTSDLASLEYSELNNKEMHIVIAGVVYKNRFPNLANEINEGKWKVSMEAYYKDYDLKIGDLIVSRKEAEALGFTSKDDSIIGKMAKVIKKGIEVASGNIARVLKGIYFSGCGIVEKPANPPSVILETANKVNNVNIEKEEVLLFDYSKIEEKETMKNLAKDNNVTSTSIEEPSAVSNDVETSELEYTDTVGICVSYKKQVLDSTFSDESSEVLHENWCALFETSCTSFSRDTTDPKCLRTIALKKANACVEKLIKEKEANDRRESLVDVLNASLKKAKNAL
jgi:hypothetical protein